MDPSSVSWSSPPGAGAGAAGPRALKRFRAGTHRLRPPEETLERVRRFMPIMGITRIANVTGLDVIGIPVVAVYRPNARSVSVSQGKGLDLAAARASGLMEAIETWHAERVPLPLRLASFNEMRFAYPVCDVAGLPRTAVGAFHPDLRLLWIEGRDLVSGGPAWVPFELVHANYTLPLPPGSGAFFMSTNGLASGNHLLEAVCHGLCEVVERDATTLWHARGEAAQARTRLDLDTVDDPACREALDRFRRAGVLVAAWETTSDVGIPAFLCVIDEASPSPLRPLSPASGAGCHPSRAVALLRALTEAAQSRLTVIAGARDDVSGRIYESAQGGDGEHVRRARARVRGEAPARSFADAPTREADSFDEDLAWAVERLAACGIAQVIAVDLTRPELGIPVARVVIPGLEGIHDAPGYLPGARARRLLVQSAQGAQEGSA